MRLYFKFLSMHFKSAMEYKVSFILTTIGQFLISFSSFLGLYFLFNRFSSIEGFSYNEVLLCYSVVLISYAVAECLACGFKNFAAIIVKGGFDSIMIRPCSELFMVFTSSMEFSSFGKLLQAIMVLIYALMAGNVEWNPQRIMVYILMIAGGILLFTGLYIIYAALCFFTIEGLEFINIFTDGGKEFGKYPMKVYGGTILKVFTILVPLACVQYYPLLYVLGRSSNIVLALSPLYTIVFLIFSIILWKYGVRNYKSTGS